jgi:hypothetical protein
MSLGNAIGTLVPGTSDFRGSRMSAFSALVQVHPVLDAEACHGEDLVGHSSSHVLPGNPGNGIVFGMVDLRGGGIVATKK